MRIALRWKTIEQENKEMELARELKKAYKPHVLENGDTPKETLLSSYWPEAGICYLKAGINGRRHSITGRKSFFKGILS